MKVSDEDTGHLTVDGLRLYEKTWHVADGIWRTDQARNWRTVEDAQRMMARFFGDHTPRNLYGMWASLPPQTTACKASLEHNVVCATKCLVLLCQREALDELPEGLTFEVWESLFAWSLNSCTEKVCRGSHARSQASDPDLHTCMVFLVCRLACASRLMSSWSLFSCDRCVAFTLELVRAEEPYPTGSWL